MTVSIGAMGVAGLGAVDCGAGALKGGFTGALGPRAEKNVGVGTLGALGADELGESTHLKNLQTLLAHE